MFDPEPYRRRIRDIRPALRKLGIESVKSEAIKFLAYYFGCQKLAYGIVGIKLQLTAERAYCRKPLRLTELQDASGELPIGEDDLCYLFATKDKKDTAKFQALPDMIDMSARLWRNELLHNFGPWNVKHVARRAKFFIPKMSAFLACDKQVLDHLAVRSTGDSL